MIKRCLFCLAILLSALVFGCARIRPPSNVRPVERMLVTTGYCRCSQCCSWHRNWFMQPVNDVTGRRKKVGETASGTMARYGTIAADTSRYPFGTILYIDGYGYGRVEDRGGSVKGDHIDLYFSSHGRARSWGKRTKPVKIWLVKRKR